MGTSEIHSKGKVDGRHARPIQHRSQLVRALVDYIREHGEVPTTDVLAEHADVSRRSVFRLFSDRAELLRSTFDQVHADLQEQMPLPELAEQTPSELIARLVDYLGDAYEFVAPFNRVLERSTRHAELIEQERERVQSMLGGRLRAGFAAMLPRSAMLSPVVRDSVRLTLAWKTWDQLRSEQSAPVKHAKAVILHALTAILRDAGVEV